tara:strand:+ start:14472 stop:15278 length:807 start_codon:yes stop_codon:yes gene_type:complete
MKIILLVNKNNISVDGVYRINKIYESFKNHHEFYLVQCKNHSITKIKKSNLPIFFKLKKIGTLINNKLVYYFKKSIEYKINNFFKNLTINKNIKYINIKTNNINGKLSESELINIKPDLIIHISSNILKSNIFNIPKYGTLNLHHGVLPFIRGLDSMYWGIYYNQARWVGATVHYINDGIDKGDIIIRRSYDYSRDNSLIDIIIGIEKLGSQLMVQAIEKIVNFESNVEKNNYDSNSIYRSKANIWILFWVLIKIKYNKIKSKLRLLK